MATASLRTARARSAVPGLLRNPWVGFLIRRLVGLALVLVGLVLATFLMVRLLPGDVTTSIVPPDAPQSARELVRSELGIDQPVGQQFQIYVTRLAHGDMGTSFITKQPVRDVIADRLPQSGLLAISSLVVVMLVSVPAGLVAAAFTQHGRRPRLEIGFTALTSVGGALPQFLTATFLAFVFAVWLRLLPVAGTDSWQSLVLPVASIALAPVFILARIVRVETLNVLAQDYIRTARSKHLSELTIYARHVLPNVLTAALTIGGLLFANIVGGAVLVENIFARIGLGTALVQAVVVKDYPVVQSVVIVLGLTVVLVNTVVDVVLGILDPRSLTRQS